MILVNWRQPELTIAAARHVAAQSFAADLIIVDNGSGDGSADIIERALPDVNVIRRTVNGGFGAGCNTGIAYAIEKRHEFVWLLNNDAAPRTDALAKLVAAMDDNTVGIVGSCLTEPHGKTPDHAGSIMNEMTLGCRSSLSAIELNAARWSWVSAASAVIRVSALKEIGSFDEHYFMYWEDADLCARLRKAGYRFAVVADSMVAHEAGTSSADQSLNRYRWHLQSHRRYIDAHMPLARVRRVLLTARYLVAALRDLDRLRARMILKNSSPAVP